VLSDNLNALQSCLIAWVGAGDIPSRSYTVTVDTPSKVVVVNIAERFSDGRIYAAEQVYSLTFILDTSPPALVGTVAHWLRGVEKEIEVLRSTPPASVEAAASSAEIGRESISEGFRAFLRGIHYNGGTDDERVLCYAYYSGFVQGFTALDHTVVMTLSEEEILALYSWYERELKTFYAKVKADAGIPESTKPN